MDPKLSDNIKMLNKIDQHIERYQDEIKKLKAQKAVLSEEVVVQIKDNKLENSVIKTSARDYKIVRRTKRQAFNKKYLTDQALAFLGDDDRAKAFIEAIYNNRGVSVSESLSSTKKKD